MTTLIHWFNRMWWIFRIHALEIQLEDQREARRYLKSSADIMRITLAIEDTRRQLVAARAGFWFGSGGHTSKDVPIYALGIGSEFFAGNYENTNIHDAILQAVAAYPFS